MQGASSLIGSAGEHFVLSALLHRGLIAAPAPTGAPNVDILVSRPDGSRLCSLQVKSRSGRGRDGGWHMRPKHERIRNSRLFYCFVNFAEAGTYLTKAPELFILPSAVVAEVLRSTHEVWLRNPGKNGHVRRDNPVRRLLPDYTRLCAPDRTPYGPGWLEPYRNAWHQIENLFDADDEQG